MDTITSTATAAMLSWPIHYTQIQSMLSSISIDHWGYAVVPILLCVVSVHLIFRHFFKLIWFSFKFLLSLLLYVQVRDVVSSFVGTDLLSLDSSFLGLPSGTIQTSKSVVIYLVKTRVIDNLASICPTCFPPPTTHPIPDPISEPIPDLIPDPMTDPITDPTTHPTTDPITDPIPPNMDGTASKHGWYRFEGWSDSIQESPFSPSSWVDMMRNVMNL